MKANLKRKIEIAMSILKVEPENQLDLHSLNNYYRQVEPRKFTVELTEVQIKRIRGTA